MRRGAPGGRCALATRRVVTAETSLVVGYDRRAQERSPVEFGVAAARCTGASLIVACAYASVTAAERLGPSQTNDRSRTLGDDGDGVPSAGIRIEWRDLHQANVARALHETAESLRAALLVVGSVRRAATRRLPGSLVERVMHGAPCPIAVVPHGWDATRRCNTIGVAYVDTPEGREALRGAHALAHRARARLRVVTAIDGECEDVAGQHGVHTVLAELASGVPVQTAALQGEPVDVLVRASRHLDVLVCGSRGYGRPGIVSLGGVGRWVARRGHCPVIMVPRGAEPGQTLGRARSAASSDSSQPSDRMGSDVPTA